MASALRTCASCFESLHRLKSDLTFFCSVHLCKLLHRFTKGLEIFCLFCSVHLCKLLRHTNYGEYADTLLLLCALVQVASEKKQFKYVLVCFCSVHLCKLLQE